MTLYTEGSQQVDLIVADLDRFTAQEIIALSLNVAANLRESPPLGTPVDTGWARANWVPSLDEPYTVEANERDPGPAQVAARAEIAAQGENDVLAWTLDKGPIFVTNNVPYIEALNEGHSQQSPRGFVQNAIELAVRQTYSAGASKAARARRAAAYRTSYRRPAR